MTDFPRRDPLDIHVPVSSLTRPGGPAAVVALCDELGFELQAWQREFLERALKSGARGRISLG